MVCKCSIFTLLVNQITFFQVNVIDDINLDGFVYIFIIVLLSVTYNMVIFFEYETVYVVVQDPETARK